MIPVRRACSVVLGCALAVAGLAGCGGGSGPLFVCVMPAARAYAQDVTTAGRVRWQAPLSAPEDGLHASLAVGRVAVFAQGAALDGLLVTDGRRVWSWADGQPIAGLWRWQDRVVVVTETIVSGVPRAVLTGLDASTGRARWTLPIGLDATGFYPTADAGLATVRYDGPLELVDLASGRVRWTRPFPAGPISGPAAAPLTVADGAVLVAVNGRLTGYDDQTGRIRWTEVLTAVQPAGHGELGSQASAGLVYLTGTQAGADGQSTQVLLGVNAADGRVKWRLAAGPQESLDAYAPGLMSVTYESGDTRQDELDPATGRVRGQIASPYHALVTPAGIVTGPDNVPGPGGASVALVSRISVRDALTGRIRWTIGWKQPPVNPGLASSVLPALPDGPLLIVPTASPDGSDLLAALRLSDGHRAWQVTIPAALLAPPSAVTGGVLVSTAAVPLPC